MMTRPTPPTPAPRDDTRSKLLDAGVRLIREKGLAATRVDEICAAAGVTKGGFFHHFATKAAWAEEVARYWSQTTGALFETAPYHQPADPLDRVLGYIDFRKAILQGGTADFTCAAGTLAQETHLTGRAICDAAGNAIFDHAAALEPDIAAAKDLYAPHADWTPRSLALYTQAALQGAFILAKAAGGPDVAQDMVDHLRRYVELLLPRDGS